MTKQSDKIDIHLGNKIRKRRRRIGITREELAKAIPCYVSDLMKWEEGRARIGSGNLYKISLKLDVGIIDLFEGFEQADVVN